MEKFKVVYTDNIYKDTSIEEQRFAEIGYDFMVAPAKDKETLKQVCRDADAVMLSFIEMDEELINSLEKCKIIVRCGMGFNNVDIAAATRKGIMVANVQKYCLDEVSDHVMALVLTLMRRTAYMSSLLKKGEWAPAKARPMYRLRGSTFALYGLGGISVWWPERLRASASTLFPTTPSCRTPTSRKWALPASQPRTNCLPVQTFCPSICL